MLTLPGKPGATCDGWSRRELLRVGGGSIAGLSLAQILELQAAAAETKGESAKIGSGFGAAKNVIMIYLQGGPSHIDIWDPKPEAPDGVRGDFANIKTSVKGIELTEVMPLLAKQMHLATLIRSVSYTPAGLFNHTAAIYQIMTGYTPDKVSPSGQLEPPAPNDYPHYASQVCRLQPSDIPMLPAVMLPRPLQESGIIQKGGTAGFLGKAHDPYYFFQDPNGKVNLTDLTLRQDVSKERLARRQSILEKVNTAMPDMARAVEQSAVNQYYHKAFDLLLSGRARNAFDLDKESKETRDMYGRHTFGQSCLLARRLIEAGTKVVQVNWPAVANGNPQVDAWDTHADNFGPLKNLHCPKLDSGISSLLKELEERGLLKETLVVALGEFGRSPRMGVSTSGNGNAAKGRDHWPYCYTALMAGAGVARGSIYGKSDETGSSPVEKPVHPTEILATVYHALGINPHTLVMNHLNQPRELVQSDPVTGVFG
ncbi:MAG: DUF1501 domain-containing protein [Phycisphaeraceae bacterium]